MKIAMEGGGPAQTTAAEATAIGAIDQTISSMKVVAPPSASPADKAATEHTYEQQQAKLSDLVQQGVLAYYEAASGTTVAAKGTAAYDNQIKDMESPQNQDLFDHAKAALLNAFTPRSPTGGSGVENVDLKVDLRPAQVKQAEAGLQLQVDVNRAEAPYTDSHGNVSGAGVLAGFTQLLSERDNGSTESDINAVARALKNGQGTDSTLDFANGGTTVHGLLTQLHAAIGSNSLDTSQRSTAEQDLKRLATMLPTDSSPPDLQTMALEKQDTALEQADLSKLDPQYKPTIHVAEASIHSEQVTRSPSRAG